MKSSVTLKDFSWERMVAAVEDVRERANRAAAALGQVGIPYMIVGGHAVAAWVSRVDAEAVRNTKDVDILLQRRDFARAVNALQSAGFVHRHVAGIDLFLDGPEGSARSALHILFAGEKVFPEYALPTPMITESEPGPGFPVPTLDALVRMKLTSFRLKDQVHLLDLLEVGLIDESWSRRVPSELSERLQELLKNRERESRQ